jgi:hypothetical protein
LFLKSKNKPIWMPKTMSDATKAVKKVSSVWLAPPWAEPAPSADVVVVAGASLLVVGDDSAVEDILKY